MDQIKIAIVHPQLVEGGGSEAPALWAAEALKEDYHVYLITMGKIYLNRLNECYGTNLKPDEIKIISIPIPYLFKKRFDALRGYRLARFCRKVASEFDLMISTYNVMDFGKKGIQYISDFSFDDRLRCAFNIARPGLKGLFYKKSFFRWLYLKLGGAFAGGTKDGWKRNFTIANSDWSKKIMKEVHGIEAITIYPPVASEFPYISWAKREDGFVCLARLVPEKRIDRIIEILGEVREKGWNIHLHILGRLDDSEYARNLRELCEKNHEWIFMEGLMIGQKKLELIAQHRFGISGSENEAFGIAVAEMVKAGCIVWVPNGSGQVEIVNHPSLIYNDVEDAVNKIEHILKNNTMQVELREHFAKQSNKFFTGKFMSEIREVVYQFLK